MATLSKVSWRMVREGGPWKYDARSLRGPACVARYVHEQTEADPQESFWVVYLDTQHRPTGTECVTRGILNASLIHPREIFRGAILAPAASIILAHNHPSGATEPSMEDLAVTRQMVQAGVVLGIPVIDHVITGEDGAFTSLAERGEMQSSRPF